MHKSAFNKFRFPGRALKNSGRFYKVSFTNLLIIFLLLTVSFPPADAYNSEEHKITADLGAAQVRIPAGVILPKSVQFKSISNTDYIRAFEFAKHLAVGFASNNESDYDKYKRAQDNYYYHGFRQESYNTKIWIPPASMAPNRVLFVPAQVANFAEPFSFGELVSFYGDYRRTVSPSPIGACFLTNYDVLKNLHFERGTSDPKKYAPAPIPASTYLRSIASGLVPPFGKGGNAFGYTAKDDEYDEAGWWGDEMMRVAAINDWHFSDLAFAWYVGLHRLALLHVDRARKNPASWITALHYEASALHSLTDLFSFGHVAVSRDKSSFSICKRGNSLSSPTVAWMTNVVSMGGGSRGTTTGLVALSERLPALNDIEAVRYNTLKWKVNYYTDLAAKRENEYHDKFNASGALVRNLNGDEFQIYGDFKLKSSSEQTRGLIIRTVRESLQSLFDAYVQLQSGKTTTVTIGQTGSSYFRALKYIPVWVEKDPDDFFPGRWTSYAGYADKIAGTNKIPSNWQKCKMTFIDGETGLPKGPASRECLEIRSAKVTPELGFTGSPVLLTVEYSGVPENEANELTASAVVLAPGASRRASSIAGTKPSTKVWKFTPSRAGKHTFNYDLGFRCGSKSGSVPFNVETPSQASIAANTGSTRSGPQQITLYRVDPPEIIVGDHSNGDPRKTASISPAGFILQGAEVNSRQGIITKPLQTTISFLQPPASISTGQEVSLKMSLSRSPGPRAHAVWIVSGFKRNGEIASVEKSYSLVEGKFTDNGDVIDWPARASSVFESTGKALFDGWSREATITAGLYSQSGTSRIIWKYKARSGTPLPPERSGPPAGQSSFSSKRPLNSSGPAFPAGPTLDDLSGTWTQSTDGLGPSAWILTKTGKGSYDAREEGLGSSRGKAVVKGNTITLFSSTMDGAYQGTYLWTLDNDLRQGTGKLVFSKKPAGDPLPMSMNSRIIFSKKN